MAAREPQPKPIVFISYAHESEAFRAQVGELAQWLAQRCEVLSDHAYTYRPPPEGWQTWMERCIERAHVVLIVCTPKLKGRYDKTVIGDPGLGAIYEGAIVTQHLYDRAMHNTKFFPILPDGGAVADVPLKLKPWLNRHYFPSGNENISRMVFDEPVAQNIAKGSDTPLLPSKSPLDAQAEITCQALQADGAKPFLEHLRAGLVRSFHERSRPQLSCQGICEWFATQPGAAVIEMFEVVRRAMKSVREDRSTKELHKQAAADAATGLYCLAACRLVDVAARDAGTVNGYVMQLQSNAAVIYGVITTALFGGALRLVTSEKQSLPVPRDVIDVELPIGSHNLAEAFERAVYAHLLKLNCEMGEAERIRGSAGPLTRDEGAHLAELITEFRDREKVCLTLVVNDTTYAPASRSFAAQYPLPLVLRAPEATSSLLAMEPSELTAKFRTFWAAAQALRS